MGKRKRFWWDVKNVVSIVQGKDFVEKLPNQYKTEVTKGGTNFSGGQKQRLSIARTLIKEPEILIFDDSFSALDFITEYNLKNELKNYLKNTTILTISQRVASLMKMDRIIVMDNGKVVGFDSHAALAEIVKFIERYVSRKKYVYWRELLWSIIYLKNYSLI